MELVKSPPFLVVSLPPAERTNTTSGFDIELRRFFTGCNERKPLQVHTDGPIGQVPTTHTAMRTIVLATAAAAVFSGCAQAFAPMAGAPGLRPAAARSMRGSMSSLRMQGDSMDDIMARLAAMEGGGSVAAAPAPAAPAYQPPAAAPAPAPAAPAYQPPAAAAAPPAYQV